MEPMGLKGTGVDLMGSKNGPITFDLHKAERERVAGGGAVGRVKEGATGDGELVRMLELDPRWNEVEWCQKKHVGYVLSGALGLDIRDGGHPTVAKGKGVLNPERMRSQGGMLRDNEALRRRLNPAAGWSPVPIDGNGPLNYIRSRPGMNRCP